MANRWTLLVLAALLFLGLLHSCGRASTGLSQRSATGELRTELENVLLGEMARLGVAPSRTTSRPPSGAANMVNDLRLEQVDDGWVMRWSYRNLGDYDQNGTVAIADITPLAQHFQETWAIGEENSLAAVIDGNGNSKVGIEDVTPIAVNFGVELGGYVVETASSPAGEYSDYDEVPHENFVDSGGRLTAELHMDVLPARYFRLSACDGDGERSVVSEVFAPELPGPEITAVRPITCAAGLAVRFEVDVTGEGLKQYAWSFGGGATPNTSNDENPVVIIGAADVYSCSVAVVTPFGIDSEDFQLLVVEPGTSPYILAVQPQSGLAGVEVTFTAEAGGDEPLTYAWDFDSAVAPENRYSSDTQPAVTLTQTPGSYPVTLTVANAHGSDNYEFTLAMVEGLDMQLLSFRVRTDGAINTTTGSLYSGYPLFIPRLSGDPNEGTASAGAEVKGEMEAISYIYDNDVHYGFDDGAPVGKTAAYNATLSYLSQLLEWSIEHGELPESELFTHDEMEPPGRLWGMLGDVPGVYIVTAHLPISPFNPSEPVELVIMLDVSD